MITAYMLNNKVLEVVPLTTSDVLPPNSIWLDVYKPDDNEREWLSGLFLEDVPEEEELDEIEASARFYWDTDGMHILSLFPQRIGGETRGVNMSFTLRNNLLISFREEDIGVVRLLRHYMRHDRVGIENAMDILTILTKSGLASSRSEARRNVEQGGVSVDGETVKDIHAAFEKDRFAGEGLVVKRGKKNFRKVILK